MATDFPIFIAPQSTGPGIDTFLLVNGAAQNVSRQAVVVASPTTFGAIGEVKAGGTAPLSSDGAAVVTQRPGDGASVGTDYSINASTWPNVHANFGSGDPNFPSWVLLQTVPAGVRFKISVDNMSTGPILCLRDDGTAATGASPVNATGFTLNPKVTAGPEGGHYESTTFRGRLQVYGASSSQFVAISTD